VKHEMPGAEPIRILIVDAYGHSREGLRVSLLGGGCQVPIGAWGRIEGGKLTLEVAVLSIDGVQCMRERGSGAPEEARAIGRTVAQNLQRHGAAELLAREGRSTSA